MTAVVYTTVGKGWVVDKIDNTYGAATFYIAFGTGGSSTGATATAGDVSLMARATEAAVLTTNSQPSADTNQWVATITCGRSGGFTVEEAGLFLGTSSATGGTATQIVIRGSHGGVALATGDSIQYTFTLQQT